MTFSTSFYNYRFESETRFYDYVRMLLPVFPKCYYALALCERCLASVAIMVSLLWSSEFYVVFIIQFSCISGIFKRPFRSF